MHFSAPTASIGHYVDVRAVESNILSSEREGTNYGLHLSLLWLTAGLHKFFIDHEAELQRLFLDAPTAAKSN